MARTKISAPATEIVPMLKTVEQMSRYSGIGINKLREMINSGEIEYIQNGNRYASRQGNMGLVQPILYSPTI